MEASMRAVPLLLAMLCVGCASFDPNKPEVKSFIEQVAKATGDQAATAAAGRLGVTDGAAVERMKLAASEAIAPQLAEAVKLISAQQTDIKGAIAAALTGGSKIAAEVGTSTGNPLAMILASLMAAGGAIVGGKKVLEAKRANA